MGVDVFVENDDVHSESLASTSGYRRLVDLFRKTLAPWDREVPALHALFGAGAIDASQVVRLLKDVERARTILKQDGAQDALDALSSVAKAAKRRRRGVAHDGPTLVPLKAAPPRPAAAAAAAAPAAPAALAAWAVNDGFTRAERARFPFTHEARGADVIAIPGGAWHGVWYRHGVVFSSGRGGHNKLHLELTVRDGVIAGKGSDTEYKAFRLDGACDRAGGVSLLQRYSRTDHAELRFVRYRARFEPKTKLIAGLLRWGGGGRDDSRGGVFLAPRTVPLKPLIALLEEYSACESAVGNLLLNRSSAKWLRAQLDSIAQGRAPAKHADPEYNEVLRDLRKVAQDRRFGAMIREVLITSLAQRA